MTLRQAELAVLNAPFERGGWGRALEAVIAATRAKGVHLLGMGGPLMIPLNIVAGDLGGIERYLGDPYLHGAVNWRIGASHSLSQIQHEAHYDAYRAAHDTADYDDAASDVDMGFGCQAVLHADQSSFLGLAVMRGRREGRCDGETLAAFAALLGPLRQAVRAQLALDSDAARLMVGDHDDCRRAIVLLDRHGAACAATPAADSALSAGLLRLDGAALRLGDRGQDRVFQAALGRMLAERGPALVETIAHDDRRNPWRLIVTRLPAEAEGLGFNPHLALTLEALGPSCQPGVAG